MASSVGRNRGPHPHCWRLDSWPAGWVGRHPQHGWAPVWAPGIACRMVRLNSFGVLCMALQPITVPDTQEATIKLRKRKSMVWRIYLLATFLFVGVTTASTAQTIYLQPATIPVLERSTASTSVSPGVGFEVGDAWRAGFGILSLPEAMFGTYIVGSMRLPVELRLQPHASVVFVTAFANPRTRDEETTREVVFLPVLGADWPLSERVALRVGFAGVLFLGGITVDVGSLD